MIGVGGAYLNYLKLDLCLRGDDNRGAGNIFVNTFLDAFALVHGEKIFIYYIIMIY